MHYSSGIVAYKSYYGYPTKKLKTRRYFDDYYIKKEEVIYIPQNVGSGSIMRRS